MIDMDKLPELLSGLGTVGAPLLLGTLILLKFSRLVGFLVLVAGVIGLGYLASTGALADIGMEVLKLFGETPAPAPTP